MSERAPESGLTIEPIVTDALEGVTPIGEITWRSYAKVAGRVRSLRVQPWADSVATLELTLVDDTGGLTIVFLGRRRIGGIKLGTQLVAEGTVVESHGRLALINPRYLLLPHHSEPTSSGRRAARRARKAGGVSG